MSLVSSNPTDPAVRLLAERLWKEYDSEFNANRLSWRDFEGEARKHVEALREAELLVTPQASSAERSEEDLVSAIAESLRDFQVSAGGMLLSLTETERRRIGWTVRGLCRQVVRDDP